MLARLLAPRAAITNSEELAREIRGGGLQTLSGAVVSAEAAMQLTAVYACVRVLAEGLAQLPLLVLRRLERGKERATDYWAYRLLHEDPNPWQTSFEFTEMVQGHAVLEGNGYALKTVVRDEVRELLPIVPSRVSVKQLPNYRLLYQVRMPDGSILDVPADRMFHLRGHSFNGIVGVNPITAQREALGVAMQLQRHEARFFKNGASIAGVLEHPGELSEPAYQRLTESFDEKFAGADNAHKTILLEEGTKFTKTGVSMRDAQFLEAMKYSRSQIASMFRVPPHMIGDLDRATFSNIEHQDLAFVKYTLGPWMVRWERRITKSLIPERDREKYFAEFLVDGLLRGDMASRYEAHSKAITTGWKSRNEVREIENLNPADGLDEFLEPAHITGADPEQPKKTDEPKPKNPPDDEEDNDEPEE